jgi:thiol-disulfide isomerase/thioredoxin
MVATPSVMLPLGTEIPDFQLPNAVDGRSVSPANYRGAVGLVVMFLCNHCPFVKHVLPELTRISGDYLPKGIAFIAINANDVETYPIDAPEHMARLAQAQKWIFPFVFDESQEVAKAFRVACTPEFYLFDAEQRLAYRGQLDASRPKDGSVPTGVDLRAAVDSLIAGRKIPSLQQPSLGCSIKWRPGNEPGYVGRSEG